MLWVVLQAWPWWWGFPQSGRRLGWGKSCSQPFWVLLLQAKWTWGPDGQGAVLLVNCDRDSPGAGGMDSGQVDIRTTAGRVSSAARGDPKGLTGVLPTCNASIPSLHVPSLHLPLRPRPPVDLQDMSVMLLRTQGPSAIFAEYQVVLHVPESDADKVRVFHAICEYFFLPCVTPRWVNPNFFVHRG